MRLINADTLETHEIYEGEWVRVVYADDIDDAPTVDAELVVHAKWIFSPDDSEGACTNCQFKIYGTPYQGHYLIVPYNYCPNCGAKMDGGKSDDRFNQ